LQDTFRTESTIFPFHSWKNRPTSFKKKELAIALNIQNFCKLKKDQVVLPRRHVVASGLESFAG
jgi:hypothetical protein